MAANDDTTTEYAPNADCDISDVDDPQEAAEMIADHLRETWTDNPDEVLVWSPETAEQKGLGAAWTVMWASGPYDWAIHLTGGESLAYSDLPGRFRPGSAEVAGLWNHPSMSVETHYGEDLQFFPK